MRPIQAVISSKAIAHNLAVARQHAPNARIMAVLKANAYGHGLINAAHALQAAEGFAVLGMGEAIDLREAGFEQKILLMQGAFDARELSIAASFGFDIVVHCEQQIKMLTTAKLKRPLNIHLKMNTGMNRLGFGVDAYQAAFDCLNASNNVAEITLMTHFANADDINNEATASSLALFNKTIKHLSQQVSLANSACVLLHPKTHTHWVRPGIMLYGASPIVGKPAADFNLQAAMRLTAQITALQTIEVGESIGYGNDFTATKKMRVGIVACGYADGYPRLAPSGTPVAVDGQLTQTVGRVSMDMLYCDLTALANVSVGSTVELWGEQVPVDIVAEASGTVGYELLCAISPRVTMKVID